MNTSTTTPSKMNTKEVEVCASKSRKQAEKHQTNKQVEEPGQNYNIIVTGSRILYFESLSAFLVRPKPLSCIRPVLDYCLLVLLYVLLLLVDSEARGGQLLLLYNTQPFEGIFFSLQLL